MARRKAKMSVEAFPARGFAAPELLEILPKVTAAYLGGDDPSLYSAADQRFGPFRWRYDARLFFRFGGFPAAPNLVSEGHLWTKFSEWSWRIWSVTSDGHITFSEARTFTH